MVCTHCYWLANKRVIFSLSLLHLCLPFGFVFIRMPGWEFWNITGFCVPKIRAVPIYHLSEWRKSKRSVVLWRWLKSIIPQYIIRYHLTHTCIILSVWSSDDIWTPVFLADTLVAKLFTWPANHSYGDKKIRLKKNNNNK